MEYDFREIEQKWQQHWRDHQTYQVTEDPTRKKFYVLNMFPYPSGAGLHVGHPLGYIASDIYARYKRQQGFNVLNPMGYDAYGLPAEQYAIQTASTGAARCAPATPATTIGPNGPLSGCLSRTTTTARSRRAPSMSWCATSRRRARSTWTWPRRSRSSSPPATGGA